MTLEVCRYSKPICDGERAKSPLKGTLNPKPHVSRTEVQYKDHRLMIASLISAMKKPVNVTVSLDEWADYAGVGKFRLIEGFREATGIPPIMFHNAEKIEIAKKLMVLEGLSVTETCFEVGFDSLGSFTSKFTAHTGVSPGRYAQMMRTANFVELLFKALSCVGNQELNEHCSSQLIIERPIRASAVGIVAAVFKRPIPIGYPKTWRLVRAWGRSTEFPAGMSGYYLAASIPFFPARAKFVNFRPSLIGTTKIETSVKSKRIEMRPPTVFDPPITLAIPALLCLKAEQAHKFTGDP